LNLKHHPLMRQHHIRHNRTSIRATGGSGTGFEMRIA
jgi:hypothetical protein